ncbi:hypothetical protein [Actinomadura fibrosa]|uniref:Secreted protein n=1 Tax=Actinomadura fibrosa TaxID=111802 RepID=A0ABW2Y1W9_9ACTN|nr:hypothetical protein [Actinomadura fibrosa]
MNRQVMRRTAPVVAAGVALVAGLSLVPGAAGAAAPISQLVGQGDIARDSLACVGPLSAGTSDLVVGNGSANDGQGNGVAVDWQLRRGDPSATFFTQGTVVQTAHADSFNPVVPSGDPSEPGTFWVCVTQRSRDAAHYEIILGAGGA